MVGEVNEWLIPVRKSSVLSATGCGIEHQHFREAIDASARPRLWVKPPPAGPLGLSRHASSAASSAHTNFNILRRLGKKIHGKLKRLAKVNLLFFLLQNEKKSGVKRRGMAIALL